MKCSYCGEEIVLVPSAKERARKYGNTPQYYTRLFTMHASCQVLKREKDTLALMRKLNKQAKGIKS